MRHTIGTLVKVIKCTDDTFNNDFLEREGLIIGHNNNGMTGNTKNDPLHRVKFNNNTVPSSHPQYVPNAYSIEEFWYEELQQV